MRLREAVRFSETACRPEVVDSKRFWMAPSWLRSEDTAVREASARWIAVLALATEVTLTVASVVLSTAIEVPAKPISALAPPRVMFLLKNAALLCPVWKNTTFQFQQVI